MNRPDFLPIAHRAPFEVEGLPDYLQSLQSQVGDFPAAVAGIVVALSERFHDAVIWTEDRADSMLRWASELLKGLPDNQGWNDVYLARWAVSGKLDPLAELVRRCINRDGSNGADFTGTDAIALLAEALEVDPLLKAELAANNVSLGSMKFGLWPSLSLPLAPRGSAAVVRIPQAAAARNAQIPAYPVTPAVFEPAPAFVPDPSAPVADLDAGMVNVGGAKLSISAAIALRDGLERAVVALLRPAEGFAWSDDPNDPFARSILLDLDTQRGEGLPVVTGGLMQGEVIQIQARGPDVNAGKYKARVYSKTGNISEFLCGTDDVNAAKCKVAERVRKA